MGGGGWYYTCDMLVRGEAVTGFVMNRSHAIQPASIAPPDTHPLSRPLSPPRSNCKRSTTGKSWPATRRKWSWRR